MDKSSVILPGGPTRIPAIPLCPPLSAPARPLAAPLASSKHCPGAMVPLRIYHCSPERLGTHLEPRLNGLAVAAAGSETAKCNSPHCGPLQSFRITHSVRLDPRFPVSLLRARPPRPTVALRRSFLSLFSSFFFQRDKSSDCVFAQTTCARTGDRAAKVSVYRFLMEPRARGQIAVVVVVVVVGDVEVSGRKRESARRIAP